jgi:hypothetical protein
MKRHYRIPTLVKPLTPEKQNIFDPWNVHDDETETGMRL